MKAGQAKGKAKKVRGAYHLKHPVNGLPAWLAKSWEMKRKPKEMK